MLAGDKRFARYQCQYVTCENDLIGYHFLVCRASRYGEEGRSVSTADSQVEDVRQDLDRFRTRASDKAGRARDQAEDKYDEAKQKGRGVWGNIKDFFGEHQMQYDAFAACLL